MLTKSLHQSVAHHHDNNEDVVFGFWIYIMSDCFLFASLFATYVVLHNNTFGGPTAKDLFSLPLVLAETMLLLTSSFTCGLAVIAADSMNKLKINLALAATFLLGLGFVVIEVSEFLHFIHAGHTWQTSAFLSGFFTLVATHGLHVSLGLIWLITLMIQIGRMQFTKVTKRKLVMFSLFWHFLDIVWIFIFTIVYLMGVL